MDKQQIKLNNKDTKELLTFVFGFVKGIDDSLQGDGKFTVSDIPNFLPSLLAVKAAFEDIDMVPVEFANMTQEEADELKVWVEENFKISANKVEEAIEDAITIVLDIWVLYVRYFNKPEEPGNAEATISPDVATEPVA